MKTKEITADQAYSTTKDTITNPLNIPRYKRRYNKCRKAVMKKINKLAKEGCTKIVYTTSTGVYDPLPASVLRILTRKLAMELLEIGYYARSSEDGDILYVDWGKDRDKKRELLRLADED